MVDLRSIRQGPRRLARLLTIATVLAWGSAAAAAEPEVKSVRFIGNPSAGSAVVWLAVDKGYFKEEGVDFQPQRDFAAGLVTDNLLAGEADVVWGGITTMLRVYSKGAPVTLIANVDYDTAWEVLVQGDSAYKSLEDLKGKSIAVISPNTYCVLALQRAAEGMGWPKDSFKFTVLAPTDQVAAFGAKRVDATCVWDPLRSQIKDEFGGRSVWGNLEPATNNIARAIGGGLVVTKEFAEKNPNTVAAMQRAMARANEEGNSNPQLVIDTLARATQQDAAKLAKIHLPKYAVPPSMSSNNAEMAKIMHDYGFIADPLDLSGFDKTSAAPAN